MTAKHSKKIAYQRRLTLKDGRRSVFVFSEDLQEICGFSRGHANKIINGKAELKPAYEQLLRFKLLSTIDGFSEGWYVDEGDIVSPAGYRMNDSMLEQFSFGLSLINDMSRDMKRLIEENKILQEKVSEPREIRVYSNDGKEPERIIRLVK